MEKDAAIIPATKIESSPSEITPRYPNNAHISLGDSGVWSQVSSNPFFTAVSLNLIVYHKCGVLSDCAGDRTGWVWCYIGHHPEKSSARGRSLEEAAACGR